jgi:hypothetical protein
VTAQLPETVRPPWSGEQVANLNAFQARGEFHPFTCGNEACPGVNGMHASLIALRDGWHCPACDYAQDWAHGFMAEPPARPHWTKMFGPVVACDHDEAEIAALRDARDGLLRDISAIARDLEASAASTSPSKKSDIEAGCARSLRALLEGQ